MGRGKLSFRGNGILLYRFGSDNAVPQFTHTKLPSGYRRGVWAFPFPYLDEFFTIHRVDALLKKKALYRIGGLKADRDADPNPAYDESIHEKDYAAKRRQYKRTLSTFWCEGPFLSRMGGGGIPDCRPVDPNWWHWDQPKVWADFVSPDLPNRVNLLGKDHLELFVPMKGK